MPDTIKKFIDGLRNEEFIETMRAIEGRVPNACGAITFQTDIDEYEIIDLKDVLYFFELKNKTAEILMKCGRKIIYPSHICGKRVNIIDYIADRYENFKVLITNRLVNVDNIVNYSTYYRKVYFENGSFLDVTGAAIALVTRNRGRERDLDHQKNSSKVPVTEYYPLR